VAFTSMIVGRTLSARHAWLSVRVGRSKNRQREYVVMFKTKNELSEEIRGKAVQLLNARLDRGLRPNYRGPARRK
jgi:hypothetical protein